MRSRCRSSLVLLVLASAACQPDEGADSEVEGPPSVWERTKLSGVDFRGIGNEPGWHVEISDDLEARAGKRIRFVYDYGEQEAVLHAPDPEPAEGRTVLEGRGGDLSIVVEIEPTPCRDTMSGEPFESTVTVQFDGRTYRGCGRSLR